MENTEFIENLRSTSSSSQPKGLWDLSTEIIRGNYGNGRERRNKLEAEGYNYHQVQDFVNKRIWGTLQDSDYNRTYFEGPTMTESERLKADWGHDENLKTPTYSVDVQENTYTEEDRPLWTGSSNRFAEGLNNVKYNNTGNPESDWDNYINRQLAALEAMWSADPARRNRYTTEEYDVPTNLNLTLPTGDINNPMGVYNATGRGTRQVENPDYTRAYQEYLDMLNMLKNERNKRPLNTSNTGSFGGNGGLFGSVSQGNWNPFGR